MRVLVPLIAAVVVATSAVRAQPAPAATPSPAAAGRPKVCLVLSGGGARGVAHVGVLKALETLRIPIDCIAGTSMGAVIGGAYAKPFVAVRSTIRSLVAMRTFEMMSTRNSSVKSGT
jgi:hypothetical protein